jgi:hypothetical protein
MPMTFFTEIEKNSKFHMKSQNTKNSKNDLEKKKPVDITLNGLKI